VFASFVVSFRLLAPPQRRNTVRSKWRKTASANTTPTTANTATTATTAATATADTVAAATVAFVRSQRSHPNALFFVISAVDVVIVVDVIDTVFIDKKALFLFRLFVALACCVQRRVAFNGQNVVAVHIVGVRSEYNRVGPQPQRRVPSRHKRRHSR
jgi:hypothetical protein